MPTRKITVIKDDRTAGPWHSHTCLRIGRLPQFEILLNDSSISRQHAEILYADDGWVVRDTGSSNGTFINGTRIGRTPQRLRAGDIITVGKIALRVESIEGSSTLAKPADGLRLEQTGVGLWESLAGVSLEEMNATNHRFGSFIHLLRDVCRMSNSANFDESIEAILKHIVGTLACQRGGILLADSTTGELNTRWVVVPAGPLKPRDKLSKTLAERSFSAGQSMLFQDASVHEETAAAQSVQHGSMASVICAILRFSDAPYGVLHLDRGPFQPAFSQNDLEMADALAAAVALGVERWRLIQQQEDTLVQTVAALSQAVEMRDPYTGNHTHRVTQYSLVLADEMALSPADRRLLEMATPLHDIGKIAVADNVLRKPGGLSETEFDSMKNHVMKGVDIVQMIPGLAWALPVVRSHHERWDGTGYPDGLEGEAIPLIARVVAVADAFDAMTTNRPYRAGLSSDKAFAELSAKAGSHFDPKCVAAFQKARHKIEAIMLHEHAMRVKSQESSQTICGKSLRQMMAELEPSVESLPEVAGPAAR